jgi:hypothetical protein
MENAGIFYGHLKYFTVIWYILWPFGNVWYIFLRFGTLCQEKSGNPGRTAGENYQKGFKFWSCDHTTEFFFSW